MASPESPKSVRDRLIDAAEECMRAKGIRATTVSEVAEVAGVSRGWLYRHFPDKVTLLGAAIVRLNNAYWTDAHTMLESIDGLDNQMIAGIQHGRTAYDDPGALLMKLRVEEPDEFAACAGAGVQGLVPDLADFWSRYLVTARDNGEVHPDTDIDDASEWIARVILSLATMPGQRLDANSADELRTHIRRYVMPGLKAAP
ncbi:TetR/AcrR family transcriptional regulator [Mycobacterium sp. CBMA293]|uniref:TetR/AcrR family transcriptional regulator n=1 Tax=unclassified Mycolicibacterium TaxID=2636767 RepID=UPI0012DDEBA8|nr:MULTISPECIES: TetR/AcrR family transcriptional regulator [unclassified Mycolicibacterium]MUL49710.1 TetR/AcrR family transcriptional regulator [Mycolicibacterium sp. CBMA 360]MUL62622.1 TetR/AcrR family transcriptional regulator [Mycolicibacterium sp. CBMA 335]MUL72559.1 TetR/AcrR family transcriptional regulator [Mycolicibacterium sp. CBMA 311]MUL95040.1 TetR/AcrR family transcriptional regulator [Mycolicibacterium sp. CBMA 230]MUM04102.1 TetR family transcriptional regulator [Mycolicibact